MRETGTHIPFLSCKKTM